MSISKRRNALLFSSILTSALFLSATAFGQAPPVYQFDIPSEKLTQSLKDFSAASSQQIVFSDEAIGDRTSPPLRGTYTRDQALAILLNGSGLQTSTSRTGVLMVQPKNAEAASNDGAADHLSLETVVVTGTHIPGVAPTGSGLTTFTRADIAKTGAATIDQFAREMPQNYASVDSSALLASSGSGFIQNGNNTNAGAGFNLHGLGAGATLTLVDGHRMTPAGSDGDFVDISLIPLSAIDRVEVLTDGASAIYGADAVAGVVNIILRNNFDGAESSVRYGSTSDGGASEWTGSQLFGRSWSGGNAMLVYEFDHQDALQATQRDYIPAQAGPTDIQPSQTRNSLFASGHQELTDRTTLSADAYYSNRTFSQDVPLEGLFPTHTFGASRAYGANITMHQELFGDWDADLRGSYSNLVQPSVSNTPAFDLQQKLTSNTELSEGALNASGTVLSLPGGNVKAAFGFDLRSEELHSVNADLTLSTGSSSFTSVSDFSRLVESVYGEIFVPIIGDQNAIPGISRLEMSAAVRYDHYSRIGSSTNPKIGLLWAPWSGLNVRGSFSTSFRAPLLDQLINAPLYEAVNLPNASAPAGQTDTLVDISSGNPSLRPETARSFSAGFDASPDEFPGLTISATYFNTNFKNRISLPPIIGGDITAIYGQPGLAPFFNLMPNPSEIASLFESGNVIDIAGNGPGGVEATFDSRFQNIARSAESGLEFSVSYTRPTDIGLLGASISTETLLVDTFQPTTSSPQESLLSVLGEPLKWRVHGDVDWSSGDLSAAVLLNYWGAYSNPLVSPTQSVDAWTTLDVNLNYKFDDGFDLALLQNTQIAFSIKNIANARPPEVSLPAGTPGAIGFDPNNANALGRIISLQLTKDW